MIFSIDFYGTNYNSFILKCFIQFACTSLDAERGGDNFLNLRQKEGVPRKWGVGSLRKGMVSTLEETVVLIIKK